MLAQIPPVKSRSCSRQAAPSISRCLSPLPTTARRLLHSTSPVGRSSTSSFGVDISKDVFHLVGLGVDGKIAFRRKIRRLGLRDVFEKLPACIVGMEACLSAHFVSRALRALGHEPRIIPAIYVKPFVKGQKNDYNDAEAVAEAALRPNLRRSRD